MGDLKQRLANVLRRARLAFAVVNAVGEDDGEQYADATVVAVLDLLAIEGIDDHARHGQNQQHPGRRRRKQPKSKGVSSHRLPRACSPGREWS